MAALVLGAITGVRAIQPGGSLVNEIAFGGSAVGIVGALLAVLLTLTGARAALRASTVDSQRSPRVGAVSGQ